MDDSFEIVNGDTKITVPSARELYDRLIDTYCNNGFGWTYLILKCLIYLLKRDMERGDQ